MKSLEQLFYLPIFDSRLQNSYTWFFRYKTCIKMPFISMTVPSKKQPPDIFRKKSHLKQPSKTAQMFWEMLIGAVAYSISSHWSLSIPPANIKETSCITWVNTLCLESVGYQFKQHCVLWPVGGFRNLWAKITVTENDFDP